jgi:uncharacterized circularly permuted ATP-grasp superfamily protein/uncharacterized alpha-E superfamily protein
MISETATSSLLKGYRPTPGAYDEMVHSSGSPRESWVGLIQALDRMGPEELDARQESVNRIIQENGVTYNIYGDTQGSGRPWELGLMPLVIPIHEWRSIEAGLIQRTRLLNLILSDFYGPQRLLREAGLPRALLAANPNFLRPCFGIRPPEDLFVIMHAVDLARAPDGRWWVLSDRTQTPSGAGYALENRIVLSQVLPDEFREGHVERLAGFFRILRDTLQRLAPAARSQPKVVLLTPGPYNETYFEHVYLARYLGFPLVERDDLTVRDRRVFLKTLEGLQDVDVILRRVDDTYCDPLELRADSILGVPGLLESARAGNVAIANALGSGAVQTPAITAFLPSLAQWLLGEELLLPSVATWWCGQEAQLAYVRDHLRELVIKPAFTWTGAEPVFGGRLKARERRALYASIEKNPFAFVAQEEVALSTVPVLASQQLAPRPMVLRAFVCAGPSGCTVLPGGLTRVSTATDRLVVSMQSGGTSKDTWILADGPVNPLSLLKAAGGIVRLERAAADVPSRVADNLYWLGRYAERLEDTVRRLRCLTVRLVGEASGDNTPDLEALIRVLIRLDLIPSEFEDSLSGVEGVIHRLIFRKDHPGSIADIASRLGSLAFTMRDRLSSDTWRILNRLQSDLRPRSSRMAPGAALALLNTLILDLAAFAGMETENMTRGHGWRFLEIGRRLERATNGATLLQAGLAVEALGFSALDPILEMADSTITYRRRYFAQPQWLSVLDLVLSDDTNPRSLSFQLGALGQHAVNLPSTSPEGTQVQESLQIETLHNAVRAFNLEAALEAEFEHEDTQLSDQLAGWASDLRGLSDPRGHARQLTREMHHANPDPPEDQSLRIPVSNLRPRPDHPFPPTE